MTRNLTTTSEGAIVDKLWYFISFGFTLFGMFSLIDILQHRPCDLLRAGPPAVAVAFFQAFFWAPAAKKREEKLAEEREELREALSYSECL